MQDIQYGKISTAELRDFLEFWPQISVMAEELKRFFVEEQELLLGNGVNSMSWCHLYELPAKVHFHLMLSGHKDEDGLGVIIGNFSKSENQIAATTNACKEVGVFFDSQPKLSKDEALELIPLLTPILVLAYSSYNSLLSLLYYGRFLNDLVDQVRSGDDKALFSAISVDPTCIGCKPIIARISKAVLIQDVAFLENVKAALGNKTEKRAQENYQKMRLVLEILHECGATKLTDNQLEQLFIKELNLYSDSPLGGGSHDALRKFANTYMKKKSRT